MSEDRHAALEVIAYGSDPRITPDHRMRALELLAKDDAHTSPEGAALFAELQTLTGEALDDELAGFFNPGYDATEEEMQMEVERRFRKAVKRWAKRKGGDAKQDAAPDRSLDRGEEPRELPAPALEPEVVTGVVVSVREPVRSTSVIRLDSGEEIDVSRPLTPTQASKVNRQIVREQMRDDRREALPPGTRQHVPPGVDPRAWERGWR